MVVASRSMRSQWLLLAWASPALAACQGESWVDARRDVAVVENGPRAVDAGDAGQDSAPPTARDDDAGSTLSADADEDRCEPYTDVAREIAGHADDFPDPGPDVAMTWRPEAAGVYVVSLTQSGTGAASFYVLQGACTGSQVAPIRGLDGGWPGFAFAAWPEQQYTFVIEAALDAETVRLTVDLGCEHADDAHCVLEDDDGEPECGLRYTAGQLADYTSCEPIDAPGEEDSRCPDTTFHELVVEGCCKPSGECGHLDPQLGCHDLAQVEWASSPPLVFYCDERAAPDQPEYFECSRDACETALDCCADPIEGNASCVDGRCVPAG